jgi:hypothetical protein
VCVARHAQRAIADQAGAEQRRGLISYPAGMAKQALIGDCKLAVAAIDLVAGEACLYAQILGRATEFTLRS